MEPFAIELFHGQLSPHLAQVYARVPQLPGGGRWTLSGKIRGPICRFAKTLTTMRPFADLGDGQTLLARAAIPDPTFWSPDVPALYEVKLELRESGAVVQTIEHELGLRFLGWKKSSFYWEGKRWVLRGIARTHVEGDPPLEAWRDAAAAMVLDTYDADLLREASRAGVVIALRGAAATAARASSLPWAAAAFHLVPSDARTEPRTGQTSYVTIASAAELDAPTSGPLAVDALLHTPKQLGGAARRQPVVATRPLPAPLPLADARAACDALQRDLAPHADCAGYLV